MPFVISFCELSVNLIWPLDNKKKKWAKITTKY